MLRKAVLLALLLLTSCAAGPTPERVGFNYPEAGIRFRPRRGVASRPIAADAAPVAPDLYNLLFPRTTCLIEGGPRRILVTGITGEWSDNRWPLYDEISVSFFGADPQYRFELTEERQIEVSWTGLASPVGALRVFHMTPLEEGSGDEQYTFSVTVVHYGNTIEFCWRDGWQSPPDEEKIEEFFYWTQGMRFREPTGEQQ